MTSYVNTLCVLCVVYACVVYYGVAGTVCQANGIQHVDDADVRFALLLQLRNHETDAHNGCKISSKGLQHYLTVEWLMGKINSYDNGAGYIPGIKIGYTSYDDCGESIYSARNSISFLNNSLSYMSSTCEGESQMVSDIAIIGPSTSSSSLTVSSLIKDYPIPIISPTATMRELSDKTRYPTFFRTVPSDEQQMSLIVDVLEQLQWTYIAVAYQNDDYGKSARYILGQKAKEKGICIHNQDLVLPEIDRDVGDHFENVLGAAKGNSIAVVVIADSVRAEQLLYAVETRVTRYKRGLHFILTSEVNTDVSVFKNERQGQGTLSFSTASELLNMDDLKTHLNAKFDHFASQSDTQHPLIKEYVDTFGHPSVFIPDSPDTFLPSTINAVMALVESLKNLHKQECGAVSRVCQKMTEKLKDGGLLQQLKTVQVNYSSIPEAIVPAAFHDSQFSFGFDAQGDLNVGFSNSTFTIHSYDSSTQNYKEVGAYINEKATLDVSKIQWLSPNGDQMQEVPSSMCAEERCTVCRNNGLVPVMYLPGEVYIVGIFSLHEPDVNDPFKCGAYRSISNDAIVAEGFLYSIKDLRAKTGIQFGAIGFDACKSQLRITSILTDFFSDISPLYSQMFPVQISRDKVVGVIGCLSSSCTISAARFFTPLSIPLVSYSASSPDLDDKTDFPFFMRTVPSDVYQARVMVNIIKQMGWEYVGLLYVNNNYGSKGMRAFRNIVDVEGSGICTPKEIKISDVRKDDDQDLFEASRMLISQGVDVVVFFGTDTRARDFIQNFETYKRWGRFIFLASEDWGVNEGIKNAGPNSARGTITLKLQTMGLESEDSFRSHLLNKKPSFDDNNVWYREFLQARNKCHFRGSFDSEYSSECEPDLTLSRSQVNEAVNDQRTRHAMNALYALGKGLNDTRNRFCNGVLKSCEYLRNAEGVVAQIKTQKRKEGSEQLSVFDSDGNGAIGFDVYNIQLVGTTYEYVKVGKFGPSANSLNNDGIKFYDEYGTEFSSLSATCKEGQCTECQHRKAPPVPVDEKVERTDNCVMDYRDSDILIISLVSILILAVIIAVAAVVVCYRMKCNQGMLQKSKSPEDRTYEQIRQVYPGHSLPHIANLQFSDPNISPYGFCTTLNRQGVTNPTFLSDLDRIDSISQAIAARGMNIDNIQYGGSTTSGNITTNHNSIQSVAPSTPSSRPPDKVVSKRNFTAPTDFISQSDNEGQGRSDVGSSIKYVNDPPSGIQRQSSIVYSSVSSPMPLSASNLQAAQNAMYNRDDVIFAKDSNGQVVAYAPSSEIRQPSSNPNASRNDGMQAGSLQPSSYYGPYSRAAALQRMKEEPSVHEQNLNNPRDFVAGDINAQQTAPQTPYEAVELQNLKFFGQDPSSINNYQGQIMQQQQQHHQRVQEEYQRIPSDRFPLQYTTPTHIISTPNAYSTSIPMPASNLSTIRQQSIPQQQQQSILQHQQQNRPFSEPISTTTPQLQMIDPALLQHLLMTQRLGQQNVSSDDLHYPQNQGQWREEGQEEPGIKAGRKDEDQNLYIYPESNNSLSSIPDLVSGRMPQQPATPSKIHRETELESIDLETNSLSNYEQEINKNQRDIAQQGNVNVTSVV